MAKSFTEISDWIVERIAKHAEIEPSEVDVNTDILNYRLDSLLMVDITAELEQWVGSEVSPSIFWEMGTISATAQFIAESQNNT